MDRFEKQILKIHGEINVDPLEGHEERFLRKLKKQNRTSLYQRIALVAASVVVILSLGILGSQTFQTNNNYTLSSVTKEQQEVEWFYNMQYNTHLTELLNILNDHPDQKSTILSEINHMDAMYMSMKTEIKQNPDDPRALSALINHYQTKIAFIEQIKEQLISISENHNNTWNYENENI